MASLCAGSPVNGTEAPQIALRAEVRGLISTFRDQLGPPEAPKFLKRKRLTSRTLGLRDVTAPITSLEEIHHLRINQEICLLLRSQSARMRP